LPGRGKSFQGEKAQKKSFIKRTHEAQDYQQFPGERGYFPVELETAWKFSEVGGKDIERSGKQEIDLERRWAPVPNQETGGGGGKMPENTAKILVRKARGQKKPCTRE